MLEYNVKNKINNVLENKHNLLKLALMSGVGISLLVFIFGFFNISPIYSPFIFLLLVLLLSKIEIGIYLMAFFLPVIAFDFSLGGLLIPLIDLLSLVVLVVFFLKLTMERRLHEIKYPHLIPFLSFFLLAIVSSLSSPNISDSIWYSFRWILFFYLAYIVLPFNIIKNKKILKNTLISFSLSALFIAGMGVQSILSQDWLNTLARVKPVLFFGYYPIGDNQNLIVETLLPGIFVLLSLKYFTKNKKSKRALDALALFIGIILLLTFSRGAWLVLFLSSTIGALIYYQKNILKYLVPLFVSIIILFPLAFYMITLQTEYSIGIGSNQSRFLLTEIAIKEFKANPLIGKGTGEYLNSVSSSIRFRAKHGDPVDSHGIIQKIMLENGFLGLLAFTFFILAIFISLFKILRKKEYLSLYLPILVAASSVFAFEFFNTSYYKGKLWFLIALALATASLIEENKIYEKKN